MCEHTCVFEYRNRGYNRALVLLPGWAADHHIFDTLDLEFNYIIPTVYRVPTLTRDLALYLANAAPTPVSLFGLSLGGFLSVEFAQARPDLVDAVILVGIRKQYPPLDLAAAELLIRQNKEAFLRQFFRQCVSAESATREAFLPQLAAAYARDCDRDELIAGLGLLRRVRIDAHALRAMAKLIVIHGAQDRIAPLSEVREIVTQLPRARFLCFEQEGHIPFFAPDFIRRFKETWDSLPPA